MAGSFAGNNGIASHRDASDFVRSFGDRVKLHSQERGLLAICVAASSSISNDVKQRVDSPIGWRVPSRFRFNRFVPSLAEGLFPHESAWSLPEAPFSLSRRLRHGLSAQHLPVL